LDPFRRKQLIILSGGVPAILVVALVMMDAAELFARIELPGDATVDRLAFVAHWFLVPGLALLAGVAFAGRRAFLPGAIDGTRTPASPTFEINLRYNQNTLEQVVLAAIAWTGLALTLPRSQLCLIPAMAFLFGIGRAAFWVGYLVAPPGRAFGMVLTALPTLASLLWLAWRAA
jgi:hypothetical protein